MAHGLSQSGIQSAATGEASLKSASQAQFELVPNFLVGLQLKQLLAVAPPLQVSHVK